MKPAEYDFEIYQGSTVNKKFGFDVSTLDLSNYDGVRMQIRQYPEQDVIVWDSEKDTLGGLTINSNDIDLIIHAETTAKFPFIECGYDIELYKNGTPELIDKPLVGKIKVVREYTRESNN